jgi:hypothetical protein
MSDKPMKPKPATPAPAAVEAAVVNLPACNICGSQNFKPGPNQRMVEERIPPVCANCGSFERHRAVRQIFDRVRPRNFARLSAVQFGKDRGIAGGWFAKLRRAEEDPKTSKADPLSLAQIALPDASVDALVASFVLESVPDYQVALREIGRVISDHGFAFIAVQSPNLRKQTQELVRAGKAPMDRYRTFGQDIEGELAALLPDLHVIRVVGQDPTTQVEGWGYFITMDDEFAGFLFERQIRARFVNIRKIIA